LKVFGAAPDLALFEKYALAVLEEARFDYERALPFLEVYLGDVFRAEAPLAEAGQIFLPDFDGSDRSSAAAAGSSLANAFFPKLGKALLDYYLPLGSPLWEDFRHRLEQTLDQQPYLSADRLSGPACETALDVFLAALTGSKYLPVEGVELKFDCHSWRCWFYKLWDQPYEWGRLMLKERLAEANGRLYYFTKPPFEVAGSVAVEPDSLLEAHGFKVVLRQDGSLEYWR